MRLSSTALFFVSLLTFAISAPINDVVIEARGEEVAREPIPLLKREAQGAPLWKREAGVGTAGSDGRYYGDVGIGTAGQGAAPPWRREAEADPADWRRKAADWRREPADWRREAADWRREATWRREADEAPTPPGWKAEATPTPPWRREADAAPA